MTRPAPIDRGMRRVIVILLLGTALASMAVFPWAWLFAVGVHPYPAGTPWTYQMWSGVVPSLTVVSVVTAVVSYLRSSNCHHRGCWRMGHYQVAAGQYKVCRHHHPDESVRRGSVTMERIIAAHRSHAGGR